MDRGDRPVRLRSEHGRETHRRLQGKLPRELGAGARSDGNHSPVDGTSTELDDTLRTGQSDLVVGFYTRQRGVVLKGEGGRGYKNALLQPMRAAFAVRKDSKDLRQALDGVLKEMWADGSLNKIKRVYLDPLEIEPGTHP